ncbi:hypothetical protein ABIE89_002210 [Bradyrhizobium niftali]
MRSSGVRVGTLPTKLSVVVPAKAGTHNHREWLWRELATQNPRNHTRLWLWIPDPRSASLRLSGTTMMIGARGPG